MTRNTIDSDQKSCLHWREDKYFKIENLCQDCPICYHTNILSKILLVKGEDNYIASWKKDGFALFIQYPVVRLQYGQFWVTCLECATFPAC